MSIPARPDGAGRRKVNHMGMQVRMKAHGKGKRVRIPHNAVAVLAERSPQATGDVIREGGGCGVCLSQNTCLHMTHKMPLRSREGAHSCRVPVAGGLHPFGCSLFFLT